MFPTQEVDKKQFKYLNKILNHPNDHWTTKMLTHLKTTDLGWAKSIITKLSIYQLETNWDTSRQKTEMEWKQNVTKAVDRHYQETLIKNCTTQQQVCSNKDASKGRG